MQYMNDRDPYRWPRRVLAVGIVLLAVPCALRAQLMQRGNAVPESQSWRAGEAAGGGRARADAGRGAGAGRAEERAGDDCRGRRDARGERGAARAQRMAAAGVCVGLLRSRAGVGVLRPVRLDRAGVHAVDDELAGAAPGSRRGDRAGAARLPAGRRTRSAAATVARAQTTTCRCRSASRTPIASISRFRRTSTRAAACRRRRRRRGSAARMRR